MDIHRPSDKEISVRIPAGDIALDGDLTIPPTANGIVLFAHGSGSSRKSPRNRWVAGMLRQHHLATLLMDLLTVTEEGEDVRTAQFRFDIDRLTSRLIAATEWLGQNPDTRDLPIGYFGASTGAAAALGAAATLPESVAAVVSRGGRPDLAGTSLPRVVAPTLLIVGEKDRLVLELNRRALRQMKAEKQLDVVPRAGHLFEEPGTLQVVAYLAITWFERHLSATQVMLRRSA